MWMLRSRTSFILRAAAFCLALSSLSVAATATSVDDTAAAAAAVGEAEEKSCSNNSDNADVNLMLLNQLASLEKLLAQQKELAIRQTATIDGLLLRVTRGESRISSLEDLAQKQSATIDDLSRVAEERDDSRISSIEELVSEQGENVEELSRVVQERGLRQDAMKGCLPQRQMKKNGDDDGSFVCAYGDDHDDDNIEFVYRNSNIVFDGTAVRFTGQPSSSTTIETTNNGTTTTTTNTSFTSSIAFDNSDIVVTNSNVIVAAASSSSATATGEGNVVVDFRDDTTTEFIGLNRTNLLSQLADLLGVSPKRSGAGTAKSLLILSTAAGNAAAGGMKSLFGRAAKRVGLLVSRAERELVSRFSK